MNIKFDNYDIDLDALNQDLAESSSTYLDSKRWAKDPEARAKWNQAYNDINSRGITGFSTNNGRYSLSHNGLEFDDPEGYYADAANFIISRAKNILNASKAKEVEPKNLEEFGRFQDRLGAYITNTNYGGDKNLMGRHWSSMDSHDEYGLYETTKRKEALKKALQDYKAALEDNKYSFEGTSYKDLNDLKFKIDAAIASLDNPNNTDYTALHQLGIDENLWFPTNEEAANEVRTAAEEKLAAENKAKQEQQIALANQRRANQYKTFRFIDISKYNGTPPTGADIQARLNSYYSLPKLNGQQQSELVGAFKYAQKNGLLRNLDRDELSKFGDIYVNNPTRLKKIRGVEGFYYDSIGNRIIQPFQGAAQQQSLQDVIDENSPEAIAKNKQAQLIKQMNSPIKGSLDLTDLSNFGFDETTGNELWAVLNDIGAFINPEAITGTAMALNAARLRDKNREGWSWERALDWITSGLGGLPVIGDAASVIKAGSNLVKLANRSARVGSFIGMAFSAVNMPEAWDSIKKIYDKGITSMTPQDIQNITYGLMGLFAGIKTISSVNARQKPQIATEYSIEIDGKKIKLPDQATADKVSAEYKAAKNNTEASQKVVKMQEVRDAAKKAGIEVTDASKVTSGSGFLRGNQVSRKLGVGKSPIKSEQVNTGEMTGGSTSGYYMPIWRKSFLNQEQKEIKNPLRKPFDWFLGRTPDKSKKEIDKSKLISVDSNKETSSYAKRPLDTNPTIMHTKSSPEPVSYNRETMSRYNDAINGRFGKESLQSGNVKVGGNGDLKVVQQTDGTYNIYFKGNQIGNERNQAEVQKIVSNVIKQLNKKDSRFGKVSAKEMGEILRSLKAKGWLRHGGKLIKV